MTLDPSPPPPVRAPRTSTPAQAQSALTGATARTSQEFFHWLVQRLQRENLDGLRSLRVDRPEIPAVIISGYLEHGFEEQVRPGELQGTVEKPFRGSTLVEVVQRALGARVRN